MYTQHMPVEHSFWPGRRSGAEGKVRVGCTKTSDRHRGPEVLRSRPPFAGVLRAPGQKVPHEVLFECFWAPASECPKECFSSAFGTFGAKKRQEALKKHSLGKSEASA